MRWWSFIFLFQNLALSALDTLLQKFQQTVWSVCFKYLGTRSYLKWKNYTEVLPEFE